MRTRNSLLKLLVNWKEQDPESLPCTEDWSEPVEGLIWRLIDWPDSGFNLVQTTCAPGLDFTYHMHPHHDEMLVVLDGYVDLEIVKKKYRLNTGDTITIPCGILHRGSYPDGAKILLVFKDSERDGDELDSDPAERERTQNKYPIQRKRMDPEGLANK